MNLKSLVLATASAVALTPINFALSSSLPTYHLTKQFALEGEGSWDYITIDSDARRLYVSHGDRLEILDADTGRKVGAISDTPRVHGAALAPELMRGFTSNGGDSTVTVFDINSLKTIKKIRVNRPDYILYDAFSRRVFPMNEKTSVLDARTGELVGQVDLGGSPEAAVSDGGGNLYVNLEDRNAIAVVDTSALRVMKTLPVGCAEPHSLSYDAANRRLLVGCSNGFRALDADSGKVVGGSVMCGGVDAGGFDPQTKLVFQSCAEGIVSVIRQATADTYVLEQTVPTQFWAKTMVYDFKTRHIYLPIADFESTKDGGSTSNASFHSSIKPGSFRVLVLEP